MRGYAAARVQQRAGQRSWIVRLVSAILRPRRVVPLPIVKNVKNLGARNCPIAGRVVRFMGKPTLSRRTSLKLLLGAGGSAFFIPAWNETVEAADAIACVATTPAVTEGPYWVDEKL